MMLQLSVQVLRLHAKLAYNSMAMLQNFGGMSKCRLPKTIIPVKWLLCAI